MIIDYKSLAYTTLVCVLFPPCDGNYHAVGLNGDRLYSVLKLLVNNFVFLPCNQCVYRMTDKHLLVFSDVSAK